jgi:hypothetical protein
LFLLFSKICQALCDEIQNGRNKALLDFSFVFSALLPALKNLFSASGIFYGGRRYHSNHRRACALLLYVTPRILLVYCDPGRGKRKRKKRKSGRCERFIWKTFMGDHSLLLLNYIPPKSNLTVHVNATVFNHMLGGHWRLT